VISFPVSPNNCCGKFKSSSRIDWNISLKNQVACCCNGTMNCPPFFHFSGEASLHDSYRGDQYEAMLPAWIERVLAKGPRYFHNNNHFEKMSLLFTNATTPHALTNVTPVHKHHHTPLTRVTPVHKRHSVPSKNPANSEKQTHDPKEFLFCPFTTWATWPHTLMLSYCSLFLGLYMRIIPR